MSSIQGFNHIAFSYTDPMDGVTVISVPDGYVECVNSSGGPSFGAGFMVGKLGYWASLADRQDDMFCSNMLQVDDPLLQLVTPYVRGIDDYNTFATMLGIKYPTATPTDPYP